MCDKPYDAVVFINDMFELEDNGIREMDTDMQKWVYHYLASQMPVWCEIYNIPYYIIQGTPQERMKEIKRVLKKHYTQKRVTDFA
jgi:nicotinamide riboside kinase